MTIQKLRGPAGITITLDSSEICPEDPGNGTPAIVELPGSSGTYNCAVNEGVLMGRRGDVALSAAQMVWLDEQFDNVNEFIEKYS